ncbi:NADH:flavin oxidoreductase/NADH oxidase family protein-like protein [Coniochaeta sp. 2T2.1]|nr:NADH:flavin oxidoreductase/NADH oxidase family protein-like protein [Coniochaeta sp. 2T2.1]
MGSLTAPDSRLFTPLKIGNVTLQHRIGMAPLTRMRACDNRVPSDLMKEYYSQRASVPGTLLIAEGTLVAPYAGGGFPNGPGIWNDEQVGGWKTITDEVHSKGSFIFSQLFGFGRAANPAMAAAEGIEIVGASAVSIDENAPIPRELTREEIKQYVRDFVAAAKNAIRAGFDGVEVHGGQGYLLDQFIQDVSNQRSDDYGGSVENRSRLVLEIIEAVVDAIGPERVGFRLSPYNSFQGMRMKNPIPQFSDIIIKASKYSLAYLHLIESRVSGGGDQDCSERIDWAIKLWDGPILVAGGYKLLADAQKVLDEEYPDKNIVIIFGRYFISNPDLVFRLQMGLELRPYDRPTFYSQKSPRGYIDYPFSPEYLSRQVV